MLRHTSSKASNDVPEGTEGAVGVNTTVLMRALLNTSTIDRIAHIPTIQRKATISTRIVTKLAPGCIATIPWHEFERELLIDSPE